MPPHPLPRPRLSDRILRLFHPRRFPKRYTIAIPPGVELRLSKRYLEWHRVICGGIPLAGCHSQTILLHPSTLSYGPRQLDHIIAHELVHVRQFERWGVVGTIVRYIRELLKNGYGGNALEREARDF